MGFKQTSSDPCLYASTDAEGEMFVYVDDIILGERARQLHHFLGVTIAQDQCTSGIWIGQLMYTENLLRKFGMNDSKPGSTPTNPDVKLTPCDDEDDVYNRKMHQSYPYL